MQLELISFKICPFVQRAVITLLYKNIPHTVTYIDLASPPEWFREISPQGKVPVLKVDDQHVIFESAIINEFLNDITSGTLLPEEPLARAIDRSWIDFSAKLILDFSALIHANDATHYGKQRQQVKSGFDLLEQQLGPGPYFNAGNFSLVDIAYAPLFMRTELLNMSNELYPTTYYPKTAAWAENLLAIPQLAQSVVSDFEAIFKGHLKQQAPFVAEHLKL